jgi:polyphosphate kinase
VTRSRRLSAEAAAPGALEDLASASRPLGLRPGGSRYSLLRETYYDTREGTLGQHDLSLCLRLDAGGMQTLELVRVCAVSLGGVAELDVTAAPVVGAGLYATLRGDSELATAVRDLVDPLALRPLVALDIDRESRELRRGLWANPTCTVHLDHILGHRGGSTRSLRQVLVEVAADEPSGPASLAAELERRHGLVSDGQTTLQRALRLLGPGHTGRRKGLPEGRLALMLLRAGSVGLVPGPAGPTVPCSPGSGEAVAASLAGDILGVPPATLEMELIGFAAAGGAGSDLEVWVHPCPPGTAVEGAVVWVPLSDLAERIGNPGLRDPTLVASLLLLLQADAGAGLMAESLSRRGAPAALPLPERAPGRSPGEDPGDFLSVELSILAFNLRVLEMAEDPGVPLLERVRFLSIFASNMDEFFVVRVGRLKGALATGGVSDDGDLTPGELLDLIAVRARALAARHYACLGSLLQELADRGVRLRRWSDLDPEARGVLARRFEEEIFPFLTPRAMSHSPGQPFPRLESLGLSLAVVLRGPGSGPEQIAHVSVPGTLRRFLPVPGSPAVVAVEDVIAAHAARLFPSFDIRGVHAFRVSRMGDVEIDEGASASLLSAVEDEVEARPYKPVVRIEVRRGIPPDVVAFLLRQLRQERGGEYCTLDPRDVFEVDGPLDLRSFAELIDRGLDAATYPPFTPRQPWPEARSVFDILRDGDQLVFHPYESFDGTVGRFLREAADDPDVVALKLTLYRTGRDSPFGDTLLRALHNGKEVSVFVELKARFDEESNIHWTRRITEAGGHVVYGVVGFKTHAKAALVVRRENGGVCRYAHVGTGNYNAASARAYTDLSLFSADPDLGADLNDFFNELTGSAGPPVTAYRRLLVAPVSLARGLSALVEREVSHALAGRPARIQAKLNGLTDRPLVRALYEAAGHGVEVDLVVRAVCTLRPGVPGLSRKIRVRSILGRFLEHARIYHFANGGAGEYYIGSADWRKRNLRKRVELAAPVLSPACRARLRAILDAELAEPRAWVLRGDGAYVRLAGEGPTAQEMFLTGPDRR